MRKLADDVMQLVDLGIEQTLDTLLLKQEITYRRITLDLQPTLGHEALPAGAEPWEAVDERQRLHARL